MKASWKGYWKSTPVLARKIGDTILVGCASLAAIMMGAPFEDTTIKYIVFGLNIVGVLGKLITNFFKDEIVEEVKPIVE